jgi:peptide-methionine (S)-S-oxide reductase
MFSSAKERMVGPDEALPDREVPITINSRHFVNGSSLVEPFAAGLQKVLLGLGCFWGAERLFWRLDGIVATSVGYAGGYTAHPAYADVCSGMTGHTEVVLVVYDPAIISLQTLLKVFWEAHDPTQGLRQGNDRGSQYRSAIYTYSPQQQQQAEQSRNDYQIALEQRGLGKITTEICSAGSFYYAEDYHQQYLAKNPGGYCGLKGTGVPCP